MQTAVVNAFSRRAIQRLRHAAERDQGSIDRRRPVLPQRRVERLAGDVLLSQVCDASFGSRRQRSGDTGVTRLIVDQRFERGGQLVGLFAREVEPEQLQRDEPPVAGVVRAKYGAKAASPDLMKDLERATGGRRRVVRGSVGDVQRLCSSVAQAIARS
jgi:hypothetical protein